MIGEIIKIKGIKGSDVINVADNPPSSELTILLSLSYIAGKINADMHHRPRAKLALGPNFMLSYIWYHTVRTQSGLNPCDMHMAKRFVKFEIFYTKE